MTSWQKTVKYAAMAFAIFLAISIIGSILGALAGIDFLLDDGKQSGVGEMRTYEISGEIRELDIEIGAADFEIKSGDTFRVESNLTNLTVQERAGRLIISEKTQFGEKIHFGVTYTGETVLDLYVPAGTVFEKADITTGAGVVSIDTLTADTLKLELGAGKVDIQNLIATRRAEIDGGAGELNILGGTLADLDLDLGVGELNFSAGLSGECDFDCGVGAANITLPGSEDDYTIQIDKGLGDAFIGNAQAVNGKKYGSGPVELDVDGGVGKIEISFRPQ